MPLPADHDGRHPVELGRGGRWIEDRPGALQGRRRPEIRDLIPANAVACRGSRGYAVVIEPDRMRRPQGTVHDRGLAQTVVQSIKGSSAPFRGNVCGIPRRGHRDDQVPGNRRSAARVGDSAQHQRAKRRAIGANEVTLGRAGVQVRHALWRERSGARPSRKLPECGHDELTRKKRALLNDEPRRAKESRPTGVEDVDADIERVGVNTQRREVGESTGVGIRRRPDEIVLELEERE